MTITPNNTKQGDPYYIWSQGGYPGMQASGYGAGGCIVNANNTSTNGTTGFCEVMY
jgi:hypothetical protein